MLKEIKILKKLPKNPYIIDIREIYETSEELIMIMEYMKGKDLYHQIKLSQKMNESQAFMIFSQVVKGLLFLNYHGVSHRDIKPDNILFSYENQLKIADFSLADYFDKTPLKGKCGTPGFMAPEVFYQETYNEKVDVFSLGIVLYMV